MTPTQSRTEYEQLRTEVEELNNALARIEDVLRDSQLSEGERIERALAISYAAKGAVVQYRQVSASR